MPETKFTRVAFLRIFRFDMKNSNVNDAHLEKMKVDKIPDVVLVKKVYAEKSLRNRKRIWKLKHMEGMHERMGSSDSANHEYDDFLEDLEEDADLRQNVNVYKDTSKVLAVDDTGSLHDGIPGISLAEMLDDLNINQDATGEEGAAMME